MCKRINALLVGVFFCVCASAFAGDDVDWSVFASWCPTGFDVCNGATLSKGIVLDEVLAPEYRAPNDDSEDTRLFSELLSVYNALTQGQVVSNLESYIHRLKADIEMRKQLYLYATGDADIPTLPSRTELRHYRKELMYLKSLQAINQKQMQTLGDHQDSEVSLELKSQVAALEHQLDDAVLALKAQLESDIEAEEHILRYFIYKREQAGE
ncbi:hypothetical protein [Vibrio alginolyticus]|uniref:hypothetical protein n=1 Tax=Vibrio alginolyticus TaxID=663 RepID=UPI0007226CDA|nr:hypothetical protein [Vibrio alginolyticus]ALR95755.1 hypothetical protein AT730_26330 [Vibrio alginolyticus]ALR95808.1 hypothetical protein AT730_24665 [Vibrio alginolyticus]MBY7710975.1 hypothetical protein [Vibrio alginolyticus]